MAKKVLNPKEIEITNEIIKFLLVAGYSEEEILLLNEMPLEDLIIKLKILRHSNGSDVYSFIVGDIFKSNNIKNSSVWIIPAFEELLLIPAQKHSVLIDKTERKLKEHKCSKEMERPPVDENSCPTMAEENFWLCLYLLIVNPTLGKKVLKYEIPKTLDENDNVFVYTIKVRRDFDGKIILVKFAYYDNCWNLNGFSEEQVSSYFEGLRKHQPELIWFQGGISLAF